jgi:SAM-dependent methyltransferase
MHAEAMDFLKRAVRLIHPAPRLVCELGSCDVNGSARRLFPDAVYIGVDSRPGKGVDAVGDAADWNLGSVLFDCVVSTETLEHTPRAAEICANAHRLLKPGGTLLMTMAGVGRYAHTSDGVPWREGDGHYRGIAEADLRRWLANFPLVLIQTRYVDQDVYVLAAK